MTAGADGTWLTRWRDPATGNQVHRSLGAFDELSPSDRYGAAKKAAEEWFHHLGLGGSAEMLTVAQACQRYLEYLKRKNGEAAAADAQGRFTRHMYRHPIAGIELQKLAAHHVADWRRAVIDTPAPNGKARSPASINRDMVALRAALNLAKTDGRVATDLAWVNALKPVKEDADKRRELYLTREQRRTLIGAAAPDIAALMRAMCALPLRPGAMAALRVKDFDARQKTLHIPKDKAGAGRTILLSDTVTMLFAQASGDKLPLARLFTRADGKPWDNDKRKDPVRRAVAASGLPQETSLYTLRHSVLTDLVAGGIDLATVAKLSGTSILMLQKNYYHLTHSTVTAALEKVAI
ncbi:MAG: tyrosine-type recombinase/integrase [Burkholderiaceae bacterium]|nr:tyrosine-type recombinase/integrase [Burkholderiaceae bacterium]